MLAKILLIPGLLAMTLACNNSHGGGTAPQNAQDQTLKEVQDLNLTVTGFQELRQSPLGHQFACSADSLKMDHRLRVGDSVLVSESRNDQKSHLKSVIKKKFISASDRSMSFSERYISLAVDEAGGEIIKGQPEGEKVCRTSPREQICTGGAVGNLMGMLTGQGRDFLTRHSDFSSSQCAVNIYGKNSGFYKKTLSGEYRLANGQVVNAIKTENEYAGTVFCSGKIFGEGSMKVIEIRSKEMVSIDEFNSCSGSRIFLGISVKLGNRTIESFRSEVLTGS